MHNIIFLDIDGVLNSMPYAESIRHTRNEHDEINPYNVKMLSKIYHAYNCKIVLSSTWRELSDVHDNEDCKRMYQYLIDTLNKENMVIYDKTPVIKK